MLHVSPVWPRLHFLLTRQLLPFSDTHIHTLVRWLTPDGGADRDDADNRGCAFRSHLHSDDYEPHARTHTRTQVHTDTRPHTDQYVSYLWSWAPSLVTLLSPYQYLSSPWAALHLLLRGDEGTEKKLVCMHTVFMGKPVDVCTPGRLTEGGSAEVWKQCGCRGQQTDTGRRDAERQAARSNCRGCVVLLLKPDRCSTLLRLIPTSPVVLL